MNIWTEHIEKRLDELESDVRDIQTRISEMRVDQDVQGREVSGLSKKLDDVADGYRDGLVKLEVALHKHEDVLLRVYDRLNAIETDVGAAKKWLSKVWPLLAALFAGAAGGKPLFDIVKTLFLP